MAVRQYVYKVERTNNIISAWQLDDYDKEGWELISHAVDYGRLTDYVYTFRRRFDHTRDKN